MLRTIAITTLLISAMPWAVETQQTPGTFSELESRAREAEGAGRTPDAFDLYVRALQAMPKEANDFPLREKIMTLSLTLNSLPPVPEQVERHSMRAQAMLEAAANEDDLDAAGAELQQAVRAAPWLPALAYNLAVVRERQQYYKAAEENLKLYLLSKPDDADEARKKMFAVGVKLERDPLAKAREECALTDPENGPGVCLDLVLAADKIGHAAEHAAHEFACRKRQRWCGSLALDILRAAAAERYPKNVIDEITNDAQTLRAADIKVDTGRVPDLIVTACRKEPSFCGLNLIGVYRISEIEKQAATEARDAEGLPYTGDTVTDGVVALASLFRRGPRTPWTDGFFTKIGSKLSCRPGQPEDCLAAGHLANMGLGRKEDTTAAKTLFEGGCNGGVMAACDAFARAVGLTKPSAWETSAPGIQVDLRVGDDTAFAIIKGGAFDGVQTILRKSQNAYRGSYQAACGARGPIEFQQVKRNAWQGTITQVDCSVTPAAQTPITLTLSRK
jgi:tetratricopeptide (TPR) repeat protein